MGTRLVVLGIPWDVETQGLRAYMSKFGDLSDCIIIKERSSGRSRGFGYVTFKSEDDEKKALDSEHILGGRTLEVKAATPKEAVKTPSKEITRIFVARIPPSVTEEMFRSYFEAFGEIIDLYMPKGKDLEGHRGIGFITFDSAECVDTLMAESHELGGSALVVEQAMPKEEGRKPHIAAPSCGFDEEGRHPGRAALSDGFGAYIPHGGYGAYIPYGGYGAYNACTSAVTRYAALGAPTIYDTPIPGYGRGPFRHSRGVSKKIFVGRLPQEASNEDLCQYFGRFGRIVDAYVPKDPKHNGHMGFGFVIFAEDGVADHVLQRSHEILGREVAIVSATPEDDSAAQVNYVADSPGDPCGGYLRSVKPNYGRLHGSLDFGTYGYGASASSRVPRTATRYRPY